MSNISRILGSISLLAGTSIGAAMLALPISTGLLGFIPTILMFLVTWCCLLYSSFLFLELTLWYKEEINIISMTSNLLGSIGKFIIWVCYVYLLYALITAYTAGGGLILKNLFISAGFHSVPAWLPTTLVSFIFGALITKGISAIDILNRVLMIFLVVSFFILLWSLQPHVKLQLLNHSSWLYLPTATSVVITSFGYHIVIPSLTHYLKRDIPSVKFVLLVGSSIPLIFYILWEIVTLGAIPIDGDFGLQAASEKSLTIFTLLGNLGAISHNASIGFLSSVFSISAIITSFFGVGVGLCDSMRDALKIPYTKFGQIKVFICCFIPPLLISILNPNAFLRGLEFAGAFGVVTLLMILPVVLVWVGRYHHHKKGPYTTPGGKLTLIGFSLIATAYIAIEIINKTFY